MVKIYKQTNNAVASQHVWMLKPHLKICQCTFNSRSLFSFILYIIDILFKIKMHEITVFRHLVDTLVLSLVDDNSLSLVKSDL